MSTTNAAVTPIARVLKSPLLAPISDINLLNDWLMMLKPTWSLSDVRAVITEVISETPDTKTFVLRPNWLWRGHRAGQHVSITVEINGVRHLRTFTLSSSPTASCQLSLTIKRNPQGRVTPYMHEQLRVGDVVTLSQAAGEFVLPARVPEKLLFLSGGSGITPLLSMLRELRANNYQGDIVFLHSARSAADAICRAELEELAAAWPCLRLQLHYSDEAGLLDMERIAVRAPELTERETFMCGPSGFMDAVIAGFAARDLSARLHFERFGAPKPRPRAYGSVQLRFSKSQRSSTSVGDRSLLEEAERAGLKPKHGCRMGICKQCSCKKVSGSVENLLTGESSSAEHEMIQICVSRAQSDLELEL